MISHCDFCRRGEHRMRARYAVCDPIPMPIPMGVRSIIALGIIPFCRLRCKCTLNRKRWNWNQDDLNPHALLFVLFYVFLCFCLYIRLQQTTGEGETVLLIFFMIFIT